MRGRAALLAVLVAGCGDGADQPKTTTQPAPAPVANRDWREAGIRAAHELAQHSPPALALRGDAGLVGVNATGSCDGSVALLRPDGRLGTLRPLGAALLAGPVPDGNGYAVLVGDPEAHCDAPTNLTLVRLDARGKVTERTAIPSRGPIDDAEIAGRAVAWIERAETLKTAVLRADGSLSEPRSRFVTEDGDVDLAAPADGDVLVAYASGQRVRAFTLDGEGREAARTVVGRSQLSTGVRVAAGPRGRAAVLWATQDGGEERELPYRVYAATRDRDGWAPRQTLDPGGKVESGSWTLGLSVSGDGRILAAWDNIRDGANRVYVAQAADRQRFRRAREVARQWALSAAGQAHEGSATVLIADEREGVRSLPRSARTRRFVREEVVHRDASTVAALAFDRHGRPVVAWTDGHTLRVARRRGA